jgi:hypothetical protein
MDLVKKSSNEIETAWVEKLALEEINMENSGVINFNEHLNPHRMLEESSIELMEELREKFEIYLTKFNELRCKHNQANSIRIFKISNTINDFMLYRNTLKLVVARKSHDTISIGFISNTGGLYSARTNTMDSAVNHIHELRAHVGAFSDISWRFQGELVNIDSLVRHYLTEFIKHSAK